MIQVFVRNATTCILCLGFQWCVVNAWDFQVCKGPEQPHGRLARRLPHALHLLFSVIFRAYTVLGYLGRPLALLEVGKVS